MVQGLSCLGIGNLGVSFVIKGHKGRRSEVTVLIGGLCF